jgi:hypothetical protein
VPILPIDLQTLFTQANQIGKEQATQKDAAPHAQSMQGSQMVANSVQRDNAVNESGHQEDGPEQVKDRAKRERRGRRRGAAAKPAAPAPTGAKDVVRDPALGRNVDISS